ncbi:MAG: hypothetical protein U5L45_03855 [Saprospiraceae bacterium]|nr:hypothetical protein [Saprospiraceae bacterium]
MVRFSGKARKTNHIPLFASEASYRLSNYDLFLYPIFLTAFVKIMIYQKKQF